jgi:membrane fusion protein, multidrug efflux system
VPRLYFVETDDAYVQADTVSVVPKVAGYVTALHVTDNTHFKANELLVEIDPRDFEDALRSAEANLQSAEASKANVLEQLSEQTHVITAAQAAIDSDRATLEFAQQELARYTRLANDGNDNGGNSAGGGDVGTFSEYRARRRGDEAAIVTLGGGSA